MAMERKIISASQVFAEAYTLMTAIWPAFLKICIFAFFCPNLLFSLAMALKSDSCVHQLRVFSAMFLRATPVNLDGLLAPALSFFSFYAIGSSLLFLAALIGTFNLVQISYTQLTKNDALAQTKRVSKSSTKLLRGVFLFGLIGLASKFEEVALGPFHILTMWLMMAVVLFLIENKTVVRSLTQAILFSYSSAMTIGAFQVAFILATFGIGMFAINGTLFLFKDFFLRADEYLGMSRIVWDVGFFNMPYTMMYFIIDVVENLAISLVAAFMPLFLVTLYHLSRPKLSQRRY